MAAPNGARKTHRDHPALPVSIAETVSEAVACHTAGATVLHAHVRDIHEKHVLDPGLYKELIEELKQQAPDLLVQVTSEAVGIYTPQQQVDCIKAVRPQLASMALKEITSNFRQAAFAREFFDWCIETNVHIQHILFSADELQHFFDYKKAGVIPESHNCVLFVLGRYAADFQSSPEDLESFLQNNLDDLNWFTCAFGHLEQACMLAGIEYGGHARVGFENNLYLADGELAGSTRELVSSLREAIEGTGRSVATPEQARGLLGV